MLILKLFHKLKLDKVVLEFGNLILVKGIIQKKLLRFLSSSIMFIFLVRENNHDRKIT